MESTRQTQALQGWIDRLKEGDESAREQLISIACQRLMHLTRSMKRSFARVGRWEETDDVFQRASMRLYQSLQHVELNDAQHFLRLAAMQIRRELIELSRRIDGLHGMARHHATQPRIRADAETGADALVYDAAEMTTDPQRMQEWSDFHRLIGELPQDQRDVVEMLWYHGLSQDEAAELMKVSTRTIKRLWRAARLALHEKLGGDLPGA